MSRIIGSTQNKGEKRAAPWYRRPWAAALLIVALQLVLFSRTLGHELVWDDVKQISQNPVLQGDLAGVLITSQQGHLDPDAFAVQAFATLFDSYRPMLYLTHWVEYRLMDGPALVMVMHGVNLLLGVLTALMALLLSLRLCPAPWQAVLAAALVGLHPLVVEPVSYISARGDIMAVLFALAATLALIRSVDTRARVGRSAALTLGACAALLLSLLSKETALAIIGVWAAMALVLGPWRAWAVRLIPLFLTVVLYMGLRSAALQGGKVGISGAVLPRAIWDLPGLILRYLQVTLLPFDLSIERLHDPAYILPGVAALVLAAGVVLYMWRRPPARRAEAVLALLGALWFCGNHAPSAVAMAETRVLADRYAYLSLVGFGWLIAGLWGMAAPRRPLVWRAALCAAAVWALMLLFVGYNQVGVWRDNERLYTHAVEMEPRSSMAHYRLGYVRARASRWPEAARLFSRAIALDPRNIRAHNNLGVAYLRLGKFKEARAVLERALRVTPRQNYRGWFNLASVYSAMGDRARACALMRRALELNPGYARARAAARGCPPAAKAAGDPR